jgi:hypothetical protein
LVVAFAPEDLANHRSGGVAGKVFGIAFRINPEAVEAVIGSQGLDLGIDADDGSVFPKIFGTAFNAEDADLMVVAIATVDPLSR